MLYWEWSKIGNEENKVCVVVVSLSEGFDTDP